MKILAKIKIFGLVQGVFFRHSAKQIADSFNLNGFAKNEPDGSVYIETEGEQEILEKFIEWCQKGPPSAKVENIKFEFSQVLKNYKGFAIE